MPRYNNRPEENLMERRTFVQVVVGAAALCSAGTLAAVQSWSLLTSKENTRGPELVPGLALRDTAEGAALYQNGEIVFNVNKAGVPLLGLADGETPFEAILERSDLGNAEDIALFFVTLGEAGYLKQHVQVDLVEAQV